MDVETRLVMLEARVAELEHEQARSRTWNDLVFELERRVVDVQVQPLADALIALVEVEGGES